MKDLQKNHQRPANGKALSIVSTQAPMCANAEQNCVKNFNATKIGEDACTIVVSNMIWYLL